ncbi:MAG: MFS transporter, partial [Hyphomicrobiaceae bacterium]|nr:MFS transporter [Hyphomicrobiaceae bacterium]
ARPGGIATLLIARLPFFYGWIILACACCAGFARQGPAVATLSIFVEPMTSSFGWSRTALSGAVSLGGIMAAMVSPLIGPVLDRQGARVMLCAAVLLTGFSTMLLSLIQSLLAFYVLFCIGRMNFAGPFDIGIYGALNSWFVQRRALATSIANLSQMAGLVALPLVAHWAIERDGWRGGWLAVGACVLLVGFVPAWLFLVRRPEDVGLMPDGHPVHAAPFAGSPAPTAPVQGIPATPPIAAAEPAFSRGQALRTPTFWLLSLYTAAVYPVQAGVSLHQAPHLIERGLSPTIAATVVSTFSLTSALAVLGFAVFARRIGIRTSLALAGACLGASAVLMLAIATPIEGFIAACCFGAGIGGVLTVLPLAWADYFGRASFGAIRGAALTVQVTAQAAGPLLSGLLRDAYGTYLASLTCFAALSVLGVAAALLVHPPRPPPRQTQSA